MDTFSTLKEQTLTFRRTITKLAGEYSAQADVIPPGWTNNIRWHAGHLVVTPQLLTRKLLGEPLECPEDYRRWFAKGTSPRDWGAAPIPELQQLLDELQHKTAALFDDMEPRRDTRFATPYTTTAGVALATPAAALSFSFCHDGIHLGLLLALRRALQALKSTPDGQDAR